MSAMRSASRGALWGMGAGLGLALLLLGCAPASPGPGDGPPTPGSGQAVTFAAADGLVVHGSLVKPSSGSTSAVVVLAHQLCSDRAEWSQAAHDWVGALSQRGVTTLAIDLRGHGQSKLFPDGSTKDLCSGGGAAALYTGMVSDVQAAVGYARTTLGAKSVAVVGASIGSNSSLLAYAADAQLAMVVALSPGLDYLGLMTAGAASQLGSRPALLEAADDDSYSADSVRQLQKLNGALTTKIWPSGGHANQLLTAHPEELPRLAGLVATALGM